MAKLLNFIPKQKGRSRGLFRQRFILFTSLTYVFSSPCLANQTTCGNTEQARELSLLIANDKGQQRSVLNVILRLLCWLKQKPKTWLREACFSLFRRQSKHSHSQCWFNITRILWRCDEQSSGGFAGGYITADDVWYALKTSTSHRQHLLAELPFYQEQDQIGIAFTKITQRPTLNTGLYT